MFCAEGLKRYRVITDSRAAARASGEHHGAWGRASAPPTMYHGSRAHLFAKRSVLQIGAGGRGRVPWVGVWCAAAPEPARERSRGFAPGGGGTNLFANHDLRNRFNLQSVSRRRSGRNSRCLSVPPSLRPASAPVKLDGDRPRGSPRRSMPAWILSGLRRWQLGLHLLAGVERDETPRPEGAGAAKISPGMCPGVQG